MVGGKLVRAVRSRSGAAMLAILVLALVLRLRAIDFGLPALYDPDEPVFVLTALRLLRDQTLNPAWFGHPGTTTIYALALIDIVVFGTGVAIGRFADAAAFGRAIYVDPGIVFLPGRLFIVACGLACIVLTFVIGRRLFGRDAGLLAALLLAVDPLHIRYSQLIRTDMHATIFVLLCVLAAIGIAERGRLRDFLWAGVWLGLACATKWPAVAVAAAIAGGAFVRMRAEPGRRAALFARLIAVGPVAVATLIAASPFLLIDFATLVQNLHGEARRHHPGATGTGFWGNLGWYLAHPLADALGPAGLAAAAIGTALACRRSVAFVATIVPVSLLFMAAVCVQALRWERWIVPLLPFASLAMAVAILTLAKRLTRPIGAALAALAALAVLIPALIADDADARERAVDTRALSSAWARAHIAPGRSVILEQLSFDLLDARWRLLFPAGDPGCIDVFAAVRDKVSFAQIERMRAGRPVVDMGTIAPASFAACRADYAILADYDRYLAEPALYADELRLYRRLIGAGRIVATFRPVEGAIGGPTIRIVALDARSPAWDAPVR